MSAGVVAVPAGTPVRLARFVAARFTPGVYVTYGVLWSLAAEGSAHLLSGPRTGWTPSGGTAVRVATVVLVLLFMRMLDDQKDLDYDRAHNPDRPLVTGAVSEAELRWSMAGLVVAVVALNALVSATSVLLAAADLGYGVALAMLERRFRRAGEGLFVNLFLAYPIQLLLSCYVYWSASSSGQITADWHVVPLALLFAAVFLQFEFARKTRHESRAGERDYSAVLGPTVSALVSLGLAVLACLLGTLLFGSRSPLGWVPGALVVLPAVGGLRFWALRRPAGLLAPAMCFVAASLGCLVALALVGPVSQGV